ncbi:MAG: calcium-binding protein [Planctomycetota bacterium]|nr:calcium-binding protein [Planctomycetota bacterium]
MLRYQWCEDGKKFLKLVQKMALWLHAASSGVNKGYASGNMELNFVIQFQSRRMVISPSHRIGAFTMWNRNKKNQPKIRRSRAVQPIVDSLEHRELYTVNAVVSGSTLSVSFTGNDSRQSFTLYPTGPSRVLQYSDGVKANQEILLGGRPVTAGQIRKISVCGNDFGNRIDLSHVSSSNGFTSAMDTPASPSVVILGLGGNDTLSGSAFADRIDGGSGDDRIDGWDGNDSLIAGSGRDTIIAGNGDDLIFAPAPSDNSLFSGGSGQDTYRGKKPGRFTISTDVERKFYS